MNALAPAAFRDGAPVFREEPQRLRFSLADVELLVEHGVTCSMSRSGGCWDNAVMESFFSSLKTERTSRRNYQTRDGARADVFDYIERFYNPRRRHSTLGYLSPIDYEKAANSG